MTLDVIGATAFGLDIDSQHNPEEPFLKVAKGVFKSAQPANRPFIFKLAGMQTKIHKVPTTDSKFLKHENLVR